MGNHELRLAVALVFGGMKINVAEREAKDRIEKIVEAAEAQAGCADLSNEEKFRETARALKLGTPEAFDFRARAIRYHDLQAQMQDRHEERTSPPPIPAPIEEAPPAPAEAAGEVPEPGVDEVDVEVPEPPGEAQGEAEEPAADTTKDKGTGKRGRRR